MNKVIEGGFGKKEEDLNEELKQAIEAVTEDGPTQAYMVLAIKEGQIHEASRGSVALLNLALDTAKMNVVLDVSGEGD